MGQVLSGELSCVLTGLVIKPFGYSAFMLSFHYDVVVVDLLFYVHGKHLWSCRDGQFSGQA